MTTTTRTRKPGAADQFAALGATPADYTPAMAIAVKQKWSGLPTDAKVADLRADLEAVAANAPTLESVRTANPDADDDETTRLLRNARVNHWRNKTRLQAALDARNLRFAKMRAARGAATATETAA